jgi:hypothetical protein
MTRRHTITVGIAAAAAAILPAAGHASPSTGASDGNPIRETRHEGEWRPWFAWKPVEVEAYRDSEIKDGKFRYTVWMRWVARRYIVIDDDERYDQDAWEGYQYRPTMPVAGE